MNSTCRRLHRQGRLARTRRPDGLIGNYLIAALAPTAQTAAGVGTDATEEPAGDSSEQRAAETLLIDTLAKRLEVQLIPKRYPLPEGGRLEFDGWCENPPIICEAWAHIGQDDKRPRTQFPTFLRRVVRAVHNLPFEPNKERDAGAHEFLMRKIAFIDLKETGGGRTSDLERVRQATKRRRSQILRQIRKWRPTHIALAGWKAQSPFKTCFPELVGKPTQGSPVVLDIYHPSSREFGSKSRPYYNHVRRRLKEAGGLTR